MSESTPKKLKTEDDAFQNYLETVREQRLKAAKSPVDFKFDKTRCRMLSKETNFPSQHKGVVYWMSRDQRVQDNWAMIYAQRLAIAEKVPLIVCFCLVPKFLQATLRQYAFMLKGLAEVRRELKRLDIPFHLLFGEAKTALPLFITKNNIGGLVTDFAPLRVPRAWVEQVAKAIPQDLPFCQVDAHNVVPVWVTSPKQEHAARTIRPKITNNLPKYLTEFPPIIKHPYGNPALVAKAINPFDDFDDLIKFLQIDKTVEEVDWAVPGTKAGFKTLQSFLDDRIKRFEEKRNNPNINALSNLSPWFHFGQISVARAIIEVKKSSYKGSAAAFIEEAVVRRELSDNFCYYNENYDSLDGALNWARETLNVHRNDKRPKVFTLKQFEGAKTHEDLWNAAQIQLVIEGKLHGFMRMYWAKKILEWSESPEEALRIAILLNDKYSLDGRDPNGYVGCMWSIAGIHDQGWKERAIFGKIRYMNYEGCKRKFDVDAYIFKYKKMARDSSIKVLQGAVPPSPFAAKKEPADKKGSATSTSSSSSKSKK